jgi:hypothetical protein
MLIFFKRLVDIIESFVAFFLFMLFMIVFILNFPYTYASKEDKEEIQKFNNVILNFCNSSSKELIYTNTYFSYIFFANGSYNKEFYEEQFSNLPFYLKWTIYPVTMSNEMEFIFFLNSFYVVDFYRVDTVKNEKGCPFYIIKNIILSHSSQFEVP